MPERYEPYVADPAEPPPRPRLERWRLTVWTLLLVIGLTAGGWLYMEGRGEEDPALQAPGTEAGG